MTRIAKMLLAALLPVAGILPALAAHTHVPTPSTWTLNLKESDFGGGPTMKSDVQTVTVDTEKRLAWTDVTVDGTGKTIRSSWDGPADGSLHPIKGIPGGMSSSNAADDTVRMVLGDGVEIAGTFSLSRDGRKLTVKGSFKDKAGHKGSQTLVYDRTK